MLTMEQCLQEYIAKQLQLSKRGKNFNSVSAIYFPFLSFLIAIAFVFGMNDAFQSAYRPYHSTETATVKIFSDICH